MPVQFFRIFSLRKKSFKNLITLYKEFKGTDGELKREY